MQGKEAKAGPKAAPGGAGGKGKPPRWWLSGARSKDQEGDIGEGRWLQRQSRGAPTKPSAERSEPRGGDTGTVPTGCCTHRRVHREHRAGERPGKQRGSSGREAGGAAQRGDETPWSPLGAAGGEKRGSGGSGGQRGHGVRGVREVRGVRAGGTRRGGTATTVGAVAEGTRGEGRGVPAVHRTTPKDTAGPCCGAGAPR